MKLLMSPQFCAVRAARRKVLYEISSSHHSPSLISSQCRTTSRPFSSTTHNHSRHNEQQEIETTTPKSESSLSHQIRLLMRRIPHPVAIITAYSSPSSSTSSTTKPIPRGMTVSSFNTVTLHPKPIITFNVRQPSETLSALQSSGRFLVHLLSPTGSMARLAHNFSRGNANLELERFEFVDYDIDTTAAAAADNNDNTSTTATIAKLPRLVQRGNDNNKNNNEETETTDFTFVLECKYLPDKSVQVYDHMIVLGTVERILSSTATTITTPSDSRRHAKNDFSLMYADTQFWKMGEEV